MTGIGQYLQDGRLSSGISLDEISEQTRISVAQLVALEEEAFGRLPGGVFNVSFARQYAEAVGLDGDQAASLLKASSSVDVALPFADESSTKSPLLMQSAASRFASTMLGALNEYAGALAGFVAAAVLIGVGVVWYNNSIAATEVAADLTPEPSKIEEVNYQAPAVRSAAIRLEMRITDTVWVRALADGERVLERILHAGETLPIEADAQVHLSVGNAGGVRLALNGERLPAFGGRGQVRRVRITPTGLTVLGGTGISNTPETTNRESASLEGPALARVTP